MPKHYTGYTPAESFWLHVEKTPTCWLWKRTLNRNGYGSIHTTTHAVGVHRFSYELHFSPIPDGMFVCHRCDVRHCVNPDHLFLGTCSDNAADMVAKGRSIVGERNPRGWLTEDVVRNIRALHRDGVRAVDLARRFNISQVHISQIVHRRRWQHID